MKLELSRNELSSLVAKQLNSLFIFDQATEGELLAQGVDAALEQCKYCFAHTANKYYHKENQIYFNPFHSGQYSIFLYFLAASVFGRVKSGSTLPDRIYYLNKCLNGLDLFYEVRMPKVFFLDHPVGSVLGRAIYGERFFFSQNCTVGNNKGVYPEFGQNVKMLSGSKVLGNCRIGDNVIIAANTYVKDCDIPECSLVFGSSPNLIIKTKPETYFANA